MIMNGLDGVYLDYVIPVNKNPVKIRNDDREFKITIPYLYFKISF